MAKIAIYGGTFNPIHNGHVYIAQQFKEKIGFDRMIFIPNSVPPHKQPKDFASEHDRLMMCKLAVEPLGFEISPIEIERGGASYTSDTLLQLKEKYPNDEFYLLMGADMFLTITTWNKPQTVFHLATLCAAPRGKHGYEELAAFAKVLEQHGAKSDIQNIEYLPVSSTMIRTAIKNNQSISKFVPKQVETYIYEHHLYRKEQ